MPGKNKNFTVLEEVNASELNTKFRSHQVYPYDRKYTRGDQTEDQYSLNVLNLEGETEPSMIQIKTLHCTVIGQ